MSLIDDEKPAIMYLRHSKADYSKFKSLKDRTLTEEGIQTSIEFGIRLPPKYRYRIFHIVYPRAIISAKLLVPLVILDIENIVDGCDEDS